MSLESAALIAAWVAILLLGLAVGGLLAQVRYLSSTAAGRAGAAPRPPRMAPDASLPAEAPLLVLFTSPDCLACNALEPSAAELLRSGAGLSRVVVSSGPGKHRPLWDGAAEYVEDPGLAAAYEVPVFPYVMVIGRDRAVRYEQPAAAIDVVEEALAVLRSERGGTPAHHNGARAVPTPS